MPKRITGDIYHDKCAQYVQQYTMRWMSFLLLPDILKNSRCPKSRVLLLRQLCKCQTFRQISIVNMYLQDFFFRLKPKQYNKYDFINKLYNILFDIDRIQFFLLWEFLSIPVCYTYMDWLQNVIENLKERLQILGIILVWSDYRPVWLTKKIDN